MYSIKVTHNDEVRRLTIPLDGRGVNAYEQLLQTVRNLFPDLKMNKSFCLTWTDDEGDTVTVSSEAELTEAIRVMSVMYGGNSLRFNVKKVENTSSTANSGCATASTSTPVSAFVAGGDRIAAATAAAASERDSIIHYGVQCDECGVSPIVGLRYKCTVRHNYDLCTTCFEKKTQPYPMIKIEDPLDRRGCRRRGGKCGRFAAGAPEGGPGPAGFHHPPPPHHFGGPHHPPHGPPHCPHGGHRGGRGGGRGGMFHWFGAGPGEGIPYEGLEDYYGPFSADQSGKEGNASTAEGDNKDNKNHPHHPPPPPHHNHHWGGPHGGRGGPHGPPRGPPLFGGRGWFGLPGFGPVVAEVYVDTPAVNANNEKEEGTYATAESSTAAPTSTSTDTSSTSTASTATGQGAVTHYGVTCDSCGVSPIKGIRYKCTVRDNFDVCAACYEGELQPYPMLKIVTSGGEGTVVTPGAEVVRDLNDEDAGLQAAISESMAKVTLSNSKLSVTSATVDEVEEQDGEVEDVYTEGDQSFTFVDKDFASTSPVKPAAAPAPAPVGPTPEEAARMAAEAKRQADEDALVLLWAKELQILSDMGFNDTSVLIPLLQENIAVPASQAEGNAGHAVKAVEGMQSVVATLLLGQSVRR